MNIAKAPGKNWKICPFPGESFALYVKSPPCWFHRLMQKLILGFRWEKE